ncbi:MAG: tautomerase family protein [Bacteroidetes bacterium]|nr:tautomerase family protein [Bacteroidota bacterium]
MPVITLDGPFLSEEKKEKLVKEFTKIASQIINIPEETFVVFIKENPYENMAQGGILISEKLKHLNNQH